MRLARRVGSFLILCVLAGRGVAAQPNILFFLIDDLRPQLGCYGFEETLSPNIDRLAESGTLFDRAYCQVPVCGASRASLLTGLYPTADRFVTYYTYAQEDAPGIPDIPTHLKANGYTTISNGKMYHHADDNAASWDEIYRPKDFRVYLKPENKGREFNQQVSFEDADVPDNAYPGGALADKIIGDLRRAKAAGTPFFITAGFTKPHLPFNAPKKYWDLYDPDKLELADNPYKPKGAPQNAMHNWGELRGYVDIPKDGPLPDEMARTLIHGYYACVSYTDAMVGKVLAELDRLGMRDDTLIVLMGDHGWQLGEHSLWAKHALFNTSLYAPLMISAPGLAAGQRTDALVEFVDLYPTLCELAGLPMPGHLQGKSIVPLLKDSSTPWKKAAFGRYHQGESVKTDRYLYTEWDDGARMLYDHQKDPDENLNISENPENQKRVQIMSRLLTSHRQQVSPASTSVADPAVAPVAVRRVSTDEPLKEVYAKDFLIGAALGSRHVDGPLYIYPVQKDPQELEVLAREFNCVTAENLMKPFYLRPAPGEFNFEQADEFMELVEENDLTVVGHVLVWHAQTPDWFFEGKNGQPVSREVLIERLREHIHTLVGRYKGRIKYWDVVNEAVKTKRVVDESLPLDEDGNPQKKMVAFYRDSPWFQIIGEDYIELAFRFAHEADPEARLLYNDFSMTDKPKVEFVAGMVRGLKAKGVPIDGVGMQAHWHLEYPSVEELQDSIDIFVATGVKVSITELDIGVLPRGGDYQGADVNRREELRAERNPYSNSIPVDVLNEQAEKYRAVFEVFRKNSADIERVTFWGISDRDSWKNNHPVRGRTDYPLLFNRNFEPKPAYEALRLR
jgi:iduronate 2-sulfatase